MGRYFAIENIEIYDSQGNVTLMYIHVGYGIIISYGFDNPIFNMRNIPPHNSLFSLSLQ